MPYVARREFTVDDVQSCSSNIHNGRDNDSERRTDFDDKTNASWEIQESIYLHQFEVDALEIKRLDYQCPGQQLREKVAGGLIRSNQSIKGSQLLLGRTSSYTNHQAPALCTLY